MTQQPEHNEDLTATLELISSRVGSGGALPAVSSMIVARNGRPAFDAAAWSDLLSGARSGGAPAIRASLLVPDQLTGQTLVWSVAEGHWVAGENPYPDDPVPETGVRFVMYAVNPATREPAEPLNALGYVQLVDESTDQSGLRLGVEAVDKSGEEDLVLLDYFVEGSVVVEGSSEITLTSEGFMTDGEERLDFSLSQTVRLPAGSSTAEVGVTYRLSRPDGASVEFTFEGTVNVETGEAGSRDPTLLVEGEGRTVEATLAIGQDDSIEGAISHGGETVIEVSGTLSEPSFTRTDGSELTAEDREALRKLVGAVEKMIRFGERIFGVFDRQAMA